MWFDLGPTSPEETRNIFRQVFRYCPAFPFLPAPDETRVADLGFYDDYRLVRLAPEPDEEMPAPPEEVYGLYAPGDFRPLDRSGTTIALMNDLAPLVLSEETALEYGIFRITFGYSPGEDSTEWQHPRIVSTLEEVSEAPQNLDEDSRTLLSGLIAPPCADRVDVASSDVSTGFVVQASVLREGPEGPNGRGIVARTEVSFGPDGSLSGLERTDAREVPLPSDAHVPSIIRTPLRVETALPVQEWHPLEADGETALPDALKQKLGRVSDWDDYLRNEYNVDDGGNITLLLRAADLPFYASFCLLEVLEQKSGGYRRSYALVRRQDAGFELRPLNGTSPVLHETNAEAGELHLTAETAHEYLRFFCWAVHGEGGPFYIPRHVREMPLRPSADDQKTPRTLLRDKYQQLHDLPFTIRAVDADEAERLDYPPVELAGHRYKAPLAYESAVFEAWFAIRPTGMVEMVHDEPRVADLPFHHEGYGSDGLFVLRPLLVSRADRRPRPSVGHYRRRDEKAKTPSADAVEYQRTAEDILSELQENGIVTKGLLRDPIRFGTSTLSGGHLYSEVQIHNHRFVDAVSLRDLSDGPALTFVDCVFEKGVCARGATGSGSWTFVGCTFGLLGEAGSTDIAVDLENASVSGNLTLFDCQVGGRVFAPGLRVSGDVRLRGSRIAPSLGDIGQRLRFDELGFGLGGDQNGPISRFLTDVGWGETRFGNQAPAISLKGAVIDGELELTSASTTKRRVAGSGNVTWDAGHEQAGAAVASVVLGTVSGRGIRVGGSIVLFGTLCLGSLTFTSARCHGNVVLFWNEVDSVPGPHLRTLGDVVLYAAGIDGFLAATNAEVGGNLSLYGTSIGENVDLLGLSTANLDMSFTTVGGYVTAFRQENALAPGRSSLRVRGDLSLSGADLNILELRGARIDGIVGIRTGRFGSLALTLGIEPTEEEDKYWASPCRVGAVQISAVTVEESLDVSGLEVRRVTANNPREDIDQRWGEFVLTHSRIGVNLKFFDERPRQSLTRRWTNQSSTTEQNESTRVLDAMWKRPEGDESSDQPVPIPTDFHSIVEQDVDLQANEIGGHLDLRNVDVAGDLCLNDTTVGLDLRMGADVKVPTGVSLQTLETRCGRLDAEKLTCEGDVNGTGLRLRGDLRARGAQVKGEFLFLKRSEERDNGGGQGEQPSGTDAPSSAALVQPKLGYAWIEGELDLEGVSANHLALTGENVPAPTAKVRLARAQIGRLEIVDPTPGPIDLSRVTVLRWVFGDESGEDGDPGAERYVDVLNKMDPFDRATWVGVEQGLRDQTKESDADEVYRAMGWKARQEGRSKRQWIPAWVRQRLPERVSSKESQPVLSESVDLDSESEAEVAEAVFLPRDPKRRSWEYHWRRWWPGPFLALSSLAVLLFILLSTNPSALELALLQWTAVVLAIGLLLVDREGLYGVTVGFGTKAWRPMVVALLALPVTFGVFSQPENVRATSDFLEVLDDDRARIVSAGHKQSGMAIDTTVQSSRQSPGHSTSSVPDRLVSTEVLPLGLSPRSSEQVYSSLEISPDVLARLPEYEHVDWSTADALALTLRYQLPIIPFFTHDRWEASSRELAVPPRWMADWMGTEERVEVGISAEEYAFLLTLWHWLAWPLFLIGAAAWAYRGRQH
jgi:hypothetical protein